MTLSAIKYEIMCLSRKADRACGKDIDPCARAAADLLLLACDAILALPDSDDDYSACPPMPVVLRYDPPYDSRKRRRRVRETYDDLSCGECD